MMYAVLLFDCYNEQWTFFSLDDDGTHMTNDRNDARRAFYRARAQQAGDIVRLVTIATHDEWQDTSTDEEE